MDTFIAILSIIVGQSLEHPQLNAGSVAVFLHRSNDLDCTLGSCPPVKGFYNFAKSALAQKSIDLVCGQSALGLCHDSPLVERRSHLSPMGISSVTM